jgi:hypothetical protein
MSKDCKIQAQFRLPINLRPIQQLKNEVDVSRPNQLLSDQQPKLRTISTQYYE